MIYTEQRLRELISVDQPLCLTDLSNEDYHASAGYSSSDIKTIFFEGYKSWKYKKNNRVEKHAFDFGDAAHCMILEPDKFKERYTAEEPVVPARRGEGKQIFQEWCDTFPEKLEHYKGTVDPGQWRLEYLRWKYPNKRFITIWDMNRLKRMRDNALDVITDLGILQTGKVESSIFWIDKETGVICKARPDFSNPEMGIISDIKTTDNCRYTAFQRTVTNRKYYVSAAFYIEALTVLEQKVYDFAYIATDKNAPHDCAVYFAEDEDTELGNSVWRYVLNMIKDRRFVQKVINPVKLPSWEQTEVNKIKEMYGV